MEEIQKEIERQRLFFREGKTLSLRVRKTALMRLEASVRRNQAEICRALGDDLHKSDVESFMTEISQVLGELRERRAEDDA